jgi:hypothetical protein
VAYTANQHHQRVRPAHMTRARQRPKLSLTGLNEMSHE